MKTRFDSAEIWRTNNDTAVSIKELETSHLMNIVRMFLRRPETVQTMLVCDIERQTRNVWRANDLVDEDAVASIPYTSNTPTTRLSSGFQQSPLTHIALQNGEKIGALKEVISK